MLEIPWNGLQEVLIRINRVVRNLREGDGSLHGLISSLRISAFINGTTDKETAEVRIVLLLLSSDFVRLSTKQVNSACRI